MFVTTVQTCAHVSCSHADNNHDLMPVNLASLAPPLSKSTNQWEQRMHPKGEESRNVSAEALG